MSLGVSDVAKYLGVTTQRAHQLARMANFPRPMSEGFGNRRWDPSEDTRGRGFADLEQYGLIMKHRRPVAPDTFGDPRHRNVYDLRPKGGLGDVFSGKVHARDG